MRNNKGRKIRSNLEGVLRKIYYAEVALEPNHHCKKEMLIAFLTYFEEFSKQRSLEFREMFQGFYHTGSYFEGLRVKMATEFDINVQLSLGLDSVDYLVNELDNPLAYATYKLNSSSYQKLTYDKIRNFFDSEHYLIGHNVLKWFQSLVDSFVRNASFSYPGVVRVNTTNSGPARTVKVLLNTEWISIDLVPVFTLSCNHLYKYTFPSTKINQNAFSSCYLVPKPLHANLTSALEHKMIDRVWRINFTKAEKDILDSKPGMKPAIQILKALRDKENWPLPSYFLKVIGLHIIISNSKQKKSNVRLDHIFLELLEYLKTSLDSGFLSHLFYRSFNLFHALNSQTLHAVGRRVQLIIQKIGKKPDQAYQLFQFVQFCSVKYIPNEIEAELSVSPVSIMHSTPFNQIRNIPKKARCIEKVKHSSKRKRKVKSQQGFQLKNTRFPPNGQNDPEVEIGWKYQMQVEPLHTNDVEYKMLPLYVCTRSIRDQKCTENKFLKLSTAYSTNDSSPVNTIPIDFKGKDDNPTLPKNIFHSKSVVGEMAAPIRAKGNKKGKKYSRKGKQIIKPQQGVQSKNACFSPIRQDPEMELNLECVKQVESLPANNVESKMQLMDVCSTDMKNQKSACGRFLKFNNAYPVYSVECNSINTLGTNDNPVLQKNIFHSNSVVGEVTGSDKVEKCSIKGERENKSQVCFQLKNVCSSSNDQIDPEMDIDWEYEMQLKSLPASDLDDKMLLNNVCSSNIRNQKNTDNKLLKFSNAYSIYGSSPLESIPIDFKRNDNDLALQKGLSSFHTLEKTNRKKNLGRNIALSVSSFLFTFFQ